MRKGALRLTSLILSLSVLIAAPNFMTLRASADNENGNAAEQLLLSESDGDNTYAYYLVQHENAQKPVCELVVKGSSYDQASSTGVEQKAEYYGKADCAVLQGQASVKWTVDVEQEGLYRVAMNYLPVSGSEKDIEVSLKLNGSVPFAEAQAYSFNREWKDELVDGGLKQDTRGNELIPNQIECTDWISRGFDDSEGDYQEAFYYYFAKGKNEIVLENGDIAFAVESLRVFNTEPAGSYASLKPSEAQLATAQTEGYFYKVQGENTFKKSNMVLYPIYDRSSPDVEEVDPMRIIRNTIGGENWSTPLQYIVWKIEVPADGYYKIGVRYRQNFVKNLFVTRKVYIDDRQAYAEMDQFEFNYCDVFQNYVLNDGNEDMLFYLTAGTHELKMEVTLGNLAEQLRIIESALQRLNEMYRKIIMVTGVEPDLLRDYNLDSEIPELSATFTAMSASLRDQYRIFESLTQKAGSEAKILEEIAYQLDSFAYDSYTIPERLSSFQTNISALAAWLLSIKSQPLEIDYLAVFSPDQSMPEVKSSLWDKILFELKAFIGSFFTDYDVVGERSEDQTTIEVWVQSGREQSNIVKELVDTYFYPETGINVVVKLVQGALLQSVMAGIGPDVGLGLTRTDPVNIALRGALAPLDGYESFDEVTQRFMPTAMDPYELDGHYYAIPETQNFHMMFYRTDILESLGLEPPETWEEFYEIAGVIQKNNMDIGLPYAGSALTTDVISIFPTLLLQNGGNYYNADKTKTLLTEKEGIDTFIQWTEFYSQYSFPMVKDDYNRFRTGEIPITIMSYTFYNQLQAAAPEIKGMWEMTHIPGTVQEDGSIDRSEAATGSAAVVMSSSEYKEESWKFLDWWTSADIQAAYGKKIEMVLGVAGRYATANVEALQKLSWSKKEIEMILSQWECVRELPEVPGGYYMTRNIDNAFRAVVLRQQDPRESLLYWSEETDKEITRKRKEYNLSYIDN